MQTAPANSCTLHSACTACLKYAQTPQQFLKRSREDPQTTGEYEEENLSDPIMQCTARQCEADDGMEPQPLKTTEPGANTQRPPTTDQPNRLACYSRFHKSHETIYILWTERETETGGGKHFKVAFSLKALLTCLSWNPV